MTKKKYTQAYKEFDKALKEYNDRSGTNFGDSDPIWIAFYTEFMSEYLITRSPKR